MTNGDQILKIAYFDCFSGISGDMTLGALVDTGVDPHHIIEKLTELNVNNEFTLTIEQTKKQLRLQF